MGTSISLPEVEEGDVTLTVCSNTHHGKPGFYCSQDPDLEVIKRYQKGGILEEGAAGVFGEDKLRPGLSVVICTYKRADSLKRCLDSLREQQRKPDELIVVDASPDRETETLVSNYLLINSCSETVIYFRVSGKHRGLTRQRNLAIAVTRYDLLAFFDDDVVLLDGCLKALERIMRERAEVAGVGAWTENDSDSTLFWKALLWLRAVDSLRPGSYTKSGVAIPTRLWPAGGVELQVDRLPGQQWSGVPAWQSGLASTQHSKAIAKAKIWISLSKRSGTDTCC